MLRVWWVVSFTAVLLVATSLWANDKVVADYERDIVPIFQTYCVSCHNEQDRESGLSLESYASLQKGGKHGPAVSPGQPESSRLYLMVTGKITPTMPPDGAEGPPPAKQALLRAWIESGARGPNGAEPDRRTLLTPRLPAAPESDKLTTALALSPDGQWLAIGRFGSVELYETATNQLRWQGKGIAGKTTRIRFSQDGSRLVTSSGVAGLYGQAVIWDVVAGKPVSELLGHYDMLYDAVLSPDQSKLATCSYDRKIILWDPQVGNPLRTLEGHNGAVYALAFSPDGTVVASASADETVKIWKTETGERLDTLSQPDREQHAVLFDPSGRHIYAAGADNRIRMWQFISRHEAQINPILDARFCHEGTVLLLDISPDGRVMASCASDGTVKVWDTEPLRERHAFPRQTDLITSIALTPDARSLYVALYRGGYQVWPIPQSPSAGETHSTPLQLQTNAVPRSMQAVEEKEGNDTPETANSVEIPALIRGVIHSGQTGSFDVDSFRFSARAGEQWVLEIQAARHGSKLDSSIEVVRADGSRIPRVLLQAVRNSYFTFRGKDSDTSDDFRLYNWEEMELNEYLYANGEVVKLWLYPRGPDSGFKVYPGFGKRHTYFDTPALAHALGEPCYIVKPYPPGSQIIPNGLPVFPIYYENDDDRLRQLGADSRLFFTAPEDGNYVVRVMDVRGFSGPDYSYELTIRPRQPDFDVRLHGQNPTIAPGSAWEFTLQADRLDDFEGPIQVEIVGMPRGFHVTSPILIEPEQWTAAGVIYVDPNAEPPTEEAIKNIRLTAAAEINGQRIVKEVKGNFGKLHLGPKPKLRARIVPAEDPSPPFSEDENWKPYEFSIAPGQTIPAKVVIERNEFDGRVPFGNEDSGRNLPHGVYVDNIGLNGLLIVEGSNERVFFITAAKWVPEQTRFFHLRARVEGEQATWPAILHVRRTTVSPPAQTGSDPQQ